MRYRLRTLLMLLAILPPLLAWGWWRYSAWREEQELRAMWQEEQNAPEQLEDESRVTILGPIVPGGPMVALDPPSDDEVVRAWERANPIQGGYPFLHEVQRKNVRIVKEKIADYVDPPRVVPRVGPVQLHHAHYKCTIYCTEITRVGWPVSHTLTDEDWQEVIYIDHNHFHMVGPVAATVAREW